jgi:hypothetical protein
MTSLELKELVKSHFSLVEADATEETINENFSEETTEEVVEEVAEAFGEIADENSAFVLKFPGDELEVGDKVSVVTTEGQEMDAPDGEHKLADGITIVTKDSTVESISKVEADEEEKDVDTEMKSEDFDARTDAEEEGYKDGEKDAIEDIKEAIAEVAKEDMMEEAPAVEDIVKEIVSAISEEMKGLKEEMKGLKEKMAAYENAPAVESVKIKSEMSSSPVKNNIQSFSIESAANADRIKLAIQQLKNKQN